LYLGLSVAQFLFKQAKSFSKSITTLTLLIFAGSFLFISFLIKKASHNPTDMSLPVLIIFTLLILSTTIGFGAYTFSTITQNKIKASETLALNSKSELQLLQSQLSPHFLFNTLNNLYGLSLIKDEKLPSLLLKLSDLLRHSVYQTRDSFVLLNEEIDYIENYIEFEKIRLNGRLNIIVNLEKSDTARIAPMLLIVFIENAFKHSKNSSSQFIKIEIKLKLWENNILFSVYNSYDKSYINMNTINKNSGLGLENAKRRLELLYPSQFDLQIDDRDDVYKVILQLKKS
jgi:LytS/YehU family sensor histidine kinase